MTSILDYNLPYRPFMQMLSDIDEEIYRSKGNKKVEDKYFHYIPIETERLVRLLLSDSFDRARYLLDNKTFLDVGCGSGRVLALVKYITGRNVQGIEIIRSVANRGKKAYGVDITIGDAFKIITPKFMEHIGVIYTYMPISDEPTMLKLHQHINDNTQHYAIRIEMLPRYLGIEDVPYYIGRIRRW